MPYREFHYRWEYDLKAPPEKLWPFVSDTNRFNRDTNVPALKVQPGKQRLRNARRRVKLSLFGMPLQWEEQPFEWVRPTRFGVTRSHSKGPIAELKTLAVLSAKSDGGTRFMYEVWAWPKSLLGLVAIPLQIGFAASRNFRDALGHDVIISRALYDDPEVRELLDSEGFEAVPFQHELKDFAQEQFELWRVAPTKKRAATELNSGY